MMTLVPQLATLFYDNRNNGTQLPLKSYEWFGKGSHLQDSMNGSLNDNLSLNMIAKVLYSL